MTDTIDDLLAKLEAKAGELRKASSGSWHRVWRERKALRVALAIAMQNKADEAA
jgi:hypothetical protein